MHTALLGLFIWVIVSLALSPLIGALVGIRAHRTPRHVATTRFAR